MRRLPRSALDFNWHGICGLAITKRYSMHSGWAEAPGCVSHRRCAHCQGALAVAFAGPFARRLPPCGWEYERSGGSPRLRFAPKVRAARERRQSRLQGRLPAWLPPNGLDFLRFAKKSLACVTRAQLWHRFCATPSFPTLTVRKAGHGQS